MASEDLSRREFLSRAVRGVAAAGLGITALEQAWEIPALAKFAASRGHLTVASFYPVNLVSGWDGLLKVWHEHNPGVSISVQVSPGATYIAKLTSEYATGTAPDIVGLENTVMIFQMEDADALEDLTPYMEKTPGFSKSEFFPRLLQRYSVGNKVYGIPYDNQPYAMLFYNKSAFAKAHLKSPTPEWTWKDLREAAQRLTIRSGGRVVRYGFDPEGNWQYFVYGAGGSVADSVTHPTRCTLDSEEAIAGIQFYLDLMYRDKVSPTPDDLQAGGVTSVDLFNTGKLGMLLDGYWRYVENAKQFLALPAGVELGPVGPSGHRVYPTGGTCYSIMKSSKNKELAWRFLTYWMGMAGHQQEYLAASEPGASYPPAYIPAFNWWAKQKNGLGPWVGAIIKEADRYVRFYPGGPYFNQVDTKIIEPGMQLILGGKKPATYLKTIAKEATAMLQSLLKHG